MSRFTSYRDDRLTVVSGDDHLLGRFIQLYDNEVETPEGEGIVLDWSEGFGITINFTGIPTSNSEIDVKHTVEEYLKERVKNLIVFTTDHSFSLN